MTGQVTATTTVGMVIAVSAGGPLSEVFGEIAAVEAIMGLGGGITMGIVSKENLRETIRGGAVGMFLAFGLGSLGPVLLSKILDLPPEADPTSPQVIAAYSYAIGLFHHLIIDKILRGKGGNDDQG